MNRQMRSTLVLGVGLLGLLLTLAALPAQDPGPKKETPKPDGQKADAAPAVKPKPLSDHVKKGLAYLVNQQHKDGGWGQGGGWRSNTQGGGRVEGAQVSDPPDVANTCVALLALIRAGSTPAEGPYARNVARGIAFLNAHIEKHADDKTLYVTNVRDTQVQSKIGPFVDTFMAALVLAEVKGKMPDAVAEKRTSDILNKVVAKIQKNQKEDGTYADNGGWAPILSQGLASKALNRAFQNGAEVQPAALDRDNMQARAGLDAKTGKFSSAGAGAGSAGLESVTRSSGPVATGRPVATTAPAGPGDAGVAIYNSSARTAALQETVNSLKAGEKRDRAVLARKDATKEEKEGARKNLDRLEKAEEAQMTAVRGIVDQLGDKGFVAGFGNNGGEEFLSFMNISETLLVKGGKDWEKWDKSTTETINKAQDQDGGWSGHHCITGRTFCTSGALLVLMADRAPVPVAAKMRGQK